MMGSGIVRLRNINNRFLLLNHGSATLRGTWNFVTSRIVSLAVELRRFRKTWGGGSSSFLSARLLRSSLLSIFRSFELLAVGISGLCGAAF